MEIDSLTPGSTASLAPDSLWTQPGRLRLKTLVALLVMALSWEAASWWAPPYVIPGWGNILNSLYQLVTTHPVWILVTAGRVLAALWISFVSGLAAATLLYFWEPLEGYLIPVVKVVMAVPVICWILFAVLWFRGTEFRIAFVLIIVSTPIFLVDSLDGMKGVPSQWKDMVRSLRPTRIQFFLKLILPAILPMILTGWKINLSLAIRVVTIAELVGATSGIGYALTLAQADFSISDIFAWTLILIGLLLASQQCVFRLESRYLRWRTRA